MASGVLGQSDLAATTNTTVYTVPSSKVATFTVNFCNRSSTNVAIRLALASTASPSASEWIEYDAIVPANGVLERTGLVAHAAERLVAYAGAANVSVSVYGFED